MTVGVNISHDSSICIKKEDSIEFFEESRFNKNKYWEPNSQDWDYKSFKKIKNFDDFFVFTSWGLDNEDKIILIKNLCDKYNIKKYFFNEYEHHIYHAVSSFYLAPFNEALCIVVDGGGASPYPLLQQFVNSHETYRECDSVYLINNQNIKSLYKKYCNAKATVLHTNLENKVKLKNIIKAFKNNIFDSDLYNGSYKYENCAYSLSSSYNPAILFNHLCSAIRTEKLMDNGYRWHEPGKAMGLSSYGDSDGMRDEDLAKQVQEVTENYTIDLIEKALLYSPCRNIVLSGGYFLNCVNNYKYTQYFKNVNFFVDPCPHDGGTALGAALWYDNYR